MDVKVNVDAVVGWRYLVRHIADAVGTEPANQFCLGDAEILEKAAAEIRRKLAEAKKGD